ncbi:non-ribosomal peptide synthetase [Solicola gregarius]|uniref:Non-ribosomal peptide synthetase n=1 Tax=Solicola gregarius TaxID=2908642 RepID=A0AA46TED3_9ACTN|nr:non-ribosomal peptide synthetase [Solicola gregarius]UYM03648.1 non-ribosomal peptide synthetase [Solicola gregarius]
MAGRREREVEVNGGDVVRDVIHYRVGHWVRRTPDSPAIVDGDTVLSYAELDARAASVAARLASDGVAIEDSVAVQIPRGHRAAVAFLGVLKAGARYVPVDPSYPPDRQRFMCDDSDSARTVTEEYVDAAVAEPAPEPRHEVVGSNAAYAVYTSGSTGSPKGVIVEHRNVCAFLDEPRLGVRPGETVAQNVSISFDVATFEIWGALCNGACLVILAGGRSIAELAADIRRVRPDWMFLTAGVFHLMVDHDLDALASVGTLQAGGDVLAPSQWMRASAATRRGLFNAYGPSETTVYSALYRADPSEQLGTSVPIGFPPVGERLALGGGGDPQQGTGEILIGGAGVSRGYHRRPRLTAERFVPDPDSPYAGARRYRSGDLGSVDADGAYRMHGRIDRQVKVRGYRIELAEIESVLCAHPDVRQAAAVTFDVGAEKRLGLFASPSRPGAVSSTELRSWLRDALPAYMIPAHVQVIDDIPLDGNGKVHRAALPSPWTRRVDVTGLGPPARPSSALEQQLCELWADTLQIDEVGVDDNYFLLGGDSLRSISLLANLTELGFAVTADEFVAHQSVGELAGLLGAGADQETAAS